MWMEMMVLMADAHLEWTEPHLRRTGLIPFCWMDFPRYPVVGPIPIRIYPGIPFSEMPNAPRIPMLFADV